MSKPGEILQNVLGTNDVMVVVEAGHSCMCGRGVKAQGAKTVTHTCRGTFATDAALKGAVLAQV